MDSGVLADPHRSCLSITRGAGTRSLFECRVHERGFFELVGSSTRSKVEREREPRSVRGHAHGMEAQRPPPTAESDGPF